MERDPANKVRHLDVRAFVGVYGPGPHQHRPMPKILGHATTECLIGSARVTLVARDEFDLLEGSAHSLVIRTGRPFLDGRPFEDGEVCAPDKLDGKFAVVVLTPMRLELVTDCIGAGSIFYASQGDHFYFSSHLGLLISALPRVPSLNDVTIASQLVSRAQVFDETHFSGTYKLPAGGHLVIEEDSRGSIDVRMMPGSGIKELLSVDAPRYSTESLRAFVNEAVARERYDDDSVLMLSGGMDSLTIALAQAPLPARVATFGETYSADFVRARRRARRLGFKFLAVPYRNWNFDTYLDEIVELNAGYSGIQTAHNISGFDWVSRHANLASIGFLGDVFRVKYLEKIKGDVNEKSVIPSLLQRIDDPSLKELFAKEIEVVVDYATQTYLDLAREYGAHRALAILKLEWMQVRWLSLTFDLCEWYLPISYPFMHRKLLASWLQADIEDVAVQKIFARSLEQALAERGYAKDHRGSLFLRKWDRFSTAAHAIVTGNHPTGRCDWQAVAERSKFPPEESVVGDDRLAEVTRRAWQRVKASGNYGPRTTVAYASAALGTACARLSQR